jgi:hypothetical protein
MQHDKSTTIKFQKINYTNRLNKNMKNIVLLAEAKELEMQFCYSN